MGTTMPKMFKLFHGNLFMMKNFEKFRVKMLIFSKTFSCSKVTVTHRRWWSVTFFSDDWSVGHALGNDVSNSSFL